MSANSRSEAREGTTYQTSVGLNLDITANDAIIRLLQSTLSVPKSKFLEFKGNAPVKSVPPSECLANIVNFLSGVGPSSTTRHTVLIGQNPSVFDTPMLLQCAGLDFKQMLSSMNVSFAVSLHLVKTLTKSGHKSLNPGEKRPKAIFHLFLSHCLTKIFKHTML